MDGDNKFGYCCGCPAQMEDARLFTNWMPNVRFNEYIKHVNNVLDNHQYRLWLQANASTIMENERQYLEKNKRCNFNFSRNVDYSENRLYPPFLKCSELNLNKRVGNYPRNVRPYDG